MYSTSRDSPCESGDRGGGRVRVGCEEIIPRSFYGAPAPALRGPCGISLTRKEIQVRKLGDRIASHPGLEHGVEIPSDEVRWGEPVGRLCTTHLWRLPAATEKRSQGGPG